MLLVYIIDLIGRCGMVTGGVVGGEQRGGAGGAVAVAVHKLTHSHASVALVFKPEPESVHGSIL